MDVRHFGQIGDARSRIRFRDFLHGLEARQRRDRLGALHMATDAIRGEDRFDLRIGLGFCAIMHPVQKARAVGIG